MLQQSSDNKDANTIQTTAETTPTLRTFSTFAAPATTTLAASTGTNVNSLVTVSNAQISETTIDPNQSGNFRLTADYTVNGDVKAGDYFTIQVPNYVNMDGDFDYSGSNNQMQTELYSPAGFVVANGVYDTQTKTLTYTFTDFVNGKDHISGSFDLAQFADRENAPYSGTYALNYDLAGEAYNTQITYAYDTHNNISYPASIGTMITEVDATNTTNTFKQVIYVNPADVNLSNAFLTIAPKDANSSAVINYNDTQLHIYKVNDPNALTDSYAFDPTVYQDLAQNYYNSGSIYTNNGGLLEINFGQIDSPYVVVMETPFDPTYSDEITTRDTFYATDYAGQSSSYYYDSVVQETSGGTGDGTVESYRLGDYVWNDTNHDGIQDVGETPIEGVTVTLKDTNGTVLQTSVTDMYGNYLFTDLANGDYVVEFTAPEGYVSTTQDAGTDNAKDSDGLVVPVTINGADDLTVDSGFYVPVPATYNLGDYVWEDSNKDGIQNSNEIGIEGVTVTLTKPDGTTVTTVTDAQGKYNFSGLENGEYKVTFTPPAGYEASPVNVGDAALDSNGLTTTATINNADNTTIDSGFFKPTVEPTPVPATYNLGDYVWEDTNKDGIQNSNEVGIEGVTVTLTKPDGTTVATVTDATGKYNFAGLENGEYTVTFTPPAGYEASPVNVGDAALDSNGLTTTATINNADNTTIDSGFFKPVVETPQDPATYTVGDKVWEDTNKDGIQNSNEVGIEGVTVTLTKPDGSTSTSTVDQDGNWTTDVPEGTVLNQGDNVTATQTDKAGNTSTPSNQVVTDTIAPDAPPINPVESGATNVTGTGNLGDTITVTFPNGNTATGTVDNDGNWTVDVPADTPLNADDVITATATDESGNTSTESSVTVTDTVAPDAPVIDPVDEGATTVTGTGTPGDNVTVTFPDGNTATGTVDNDGNWTVDVPEGTTVNKGDVITATATDEAGNTSDESSVTVTGKADNATPPANDDNQGGTTVVTPEPPVINQVPEESPSVTGTATPGNTVEVTFPDGHTETATVNQEGGWSVPAVEGKALESGEVITAVETDKAGNTSKVVRAIVGDNTGSEPAENQSAEEALPDTGQNDNAKNATLFGSLFALLGSIFLFGKRRKEDKEK